MKLRPVLRRLVWGALYVGLIFFVRQVVLSSTKGGAPPPLPKSAVTGGSPAPTQSGVTITGFTPAQGVRGTPVTITGTGFSTNPAQNTVLFNSVPGTVTAASRTTIVALAPDSGTGIITVTSPSGAASLSSPEFTYQPNIFVTPEFAVLPIPSPGSLQLTANLRDISGSIEWSVNGIVGGNSQVGTITPQGLYTAPSSVPSCGATVQIKARSVSSPERIAISTTTIRMYTFNS